MDKTPECDGRTDRRMEGHTDLLWLLQRSAFEQYGRAVINATQHLTQCVTKKIYTKTSSAIIQHKRDSSHQVIFRHFQSVRSEVRFLRVTHLAYSDRYDPLFKAVPTIVERTYILPLSLFDTQSLSSRRPRDASSTVYQRFGRIDRTSKIRSDIRPSLP